MSLKKYKTILLPFLLLFTNCTEATMEYSPSKEGKEHFLHLYPNQNNGKCSTLLKEAEKQTSKLVKEEPARYSPYLVRYPTLSHNSITQGLQP